MPYTNFETNFLPMGTELEVAHNVRANAGSGDSQRVRDQNRIQRYRFFKAGDENWSAEKWERELRDRGFDRYSVRKKAPMA